jgi:hypothetical protein
MAEKLFVPQVETKQYFVRKLREVLFKHFSYTCIRRKNVLLPQERSNNSLDERKEKEKKKNIFLHYSFPLIILDCMKCSFKVDY